MNKEKIVDHFLTNSNVKKYLMGINDISHELCKLVSVDGFIDDFTESKFFCNLPIIKTKDVPKDAIVTSCSLAIWPVSISNLLSRYNINHVSVLDLIKDERIDLPIPYLNTFKADYEVNRSFYDNLKDILEDKKSKDLLENIIKFRIHGHLNAMDEYEVNVKTQYFEDFLIFKPGSTFIDVGGYDGNTSIEFIKRCPNYGQIYIFEPSEINYKSVLKNLGSYPNITVIRKGLSDSKQKLNFSDQLGSKSGVTKDGNVFIEVDQLDKILPKDVDVNFIKMDIEGSEANALNGATKTILSCHPILAISVYHKPNDIRLIYEQIIKIRNDYRVYLRHYTEGTDETVMFFIPKE